MRNHRHFEKRSGNIIFIKEILQNFSAMGTLVPTSNHAARQMARQVVSADEGYIVELGAGTGAITAALLNQVSDHSKLIIIEQSKDLADHLKRRFPNLNIIHGDALHLQELLGDKSQSVSAIVSALPLAVMPKPIVDEISRQIHLVLKKHGRLIQISYHWRRSYPYFQDQFKRLYSKYVWLNIPPARIHVLEHGC